MATPMTPSQIVAQLKKWGIPYREYKDWRTHNRNHVGKWGPVNGFMVHHTGSDSSDQRFLLYNGVSGLPGPLCHFGLAHDGTVHLIGWGRANHAGAGDPDVLDAVINESYGSYPPPDNQSTVDGNARFYGVEIWYSGSHPMTDAQYRTLRLLAAAILDFHGWTEKSVIGHGEWGSPGKWDPGYAPGKMMDMAKVRADIKATLKAGPSSVAKAPVSSTSGGTSATADGGKDMPKLINIARKAPFTINKPGAWDAVEFDTVYKDEVGDLVKGGSQFVKGPAVFTGEVTFEVEAPKGTTLQARITEVDSDGDYGVSRPNGEMIATAGKTFFKVPFTTHVWSGKGVRVRLCYYDSDKPVKVTKVSLETLVWKR